jgi:hypothetical protein
LHAKASWSGPSSRHPQLHTLSQTLERLSARHSVDGHGSERGSGGTAVGGGRGDPSTVIPVWAHPPTAPRQWSRQSACARGELWRGGSGCWRLQARVRCAGPSSRHPQLTTRAMSHALSHTAWSWTLVKEDARCPLLTGNPTSQHKHDGSCM